MTSPAGLSPRVAAARDALATVTTWGRELPIELVLAAAAAYAELETREPVPFPPAHPPRVDPQLTEAQARNLCRRAYQLLVAELADAAPVHAVALGFAARELSDVTAAGGRAP